MGDDKEVIRAKIFHEKQKFWGSEEAIATSGGAKRLQRKSKKASNILLFIITLMLSIAVFAYILFYFAV